MSYNAYLRWVVIGGIFVIPLIPFIIADGGGLWLKYPLTYIPFPSLFFPYITGKSFVFRLLVEMLLLFYIPLALREPKFRPRASWIFWAALAFVVWMGVATIFSVDSTKSFWSNFERMEGYVGLLHLFAYFVIAGAVLSAAGLWERFLNTTVGASVFMGVIALLQLFGAVPISSQSGPRIDTTFGNAIYTAVYMLVHVFLTLFLIARVRERAPRALPWWYAFYGVAFVLQVTTLYYTQTRGALLGLAAGIFLSALYLLFFARGKENAALRRAAVSGIAVILLILGGLFAARNTSFVQNNGTLSRLTSISLNDATTQARLSYIWPMALKGAVERPIIGWGQENFSFVFNKNYDPGMYGQEQWFDRAHNQFLDWFIAGGIPAGFLYVALYALAACAIIRTDALDVLARAVLLGFLAAFALNNMTVFDNLMSAVLFMTMLAYLHSLSKRDLPGALFLSRPVGDRGVAVAAPALAVAIIFGAWSLNAAGIERGHALSYAVSDTEPGKALAQFKEAVKPSLWPNTSLGSQETAEQLMQYASNSVAPAQSVDPHLKQEFYILARGAMLREIESRQGDARLELFMGTFLAQFGQVGEALEHLQKALALSPKKQQMLFQLGFVHLNGGDAGGGVAYFKQAFEEEPRYDLARVFYAEALYLTGNGTQADALILERWGTLAVDDAQLVQVYIQTKKYDRLVAIWQKRLESSPNSVDLHLGLAEIYFMAGRKDETIKELERVAQLSPSQAAQMQSLINQIRDGTLKP